MEPDKDSRELTAEEKAELLAAIQEAEDEVAKGLVISHDEMKRRIESWNLK